MPELVTLSLMILVPLSVHAGLFSVIFSDVKTGAPQETITYTPNAQTATLLSAAYHSDPNPAKGGGDILVSDGALVPGRTIDGREQKINTKTASGEISVYVVREGDTLSQIAEMYNISAKTILWANSISNPSKIKPGDSLVILPITGVQHVVKKGDTYERIAKKYDGDVEDILAYNQLTIDSPLTEGDTIVIPDGIISVPAPTQKPTAKNGESVKSGSGLGFINPLPGSVKTQGIHGYNGVDLSGVAVGSRVVAAAGGDVIVARTSGWNGGYGLYVVIRHPNGTQTLYAHLSSVSVSVGQKVSQGTVIGGMGNSGRSTGPHLHFEVRGAKNPF